MVQHPAPGFVPKLERGLLHGLGMGLLLEKKYKGSPSSSGNASSAGCFGSRVFKALWHCSSIHVAKVALVWYASGSSLLCMAARKVFKFAPVLVQRVQINRPRDDFGQFWRSGRQCLLSWQHFNAILVQMPFAKCLCKCPLQIEGRVVQSPSPLVG